MGLCYIFPGNSTHAPSFFCWVAVVVESHIWAFAAPGGGSLLWNTEKEGDWGYLHSVLVSGLDYWRGRALNLFCMLMLGLFTGSG